MHNMIKIKTHIPQTTHPRRPCIHVFVHRYLEREPVEEQPPRGDDPDDVRAALRVVQVRGQEPVGHQRHQAERPDGQGERVVADEPEEAVDAAPAAAPAPAAGRLGGERAWR